MGEGLKMAKEDWFEIWYQDKHDMLDAMTHNLSADLSAGYNYFGDSAVKQRKDIDDYKKQFDDEMVMLSNMDANKVQHWCYFDLKRRGVIS